MKKVFSNKKKLSLFDVIFWIFIIFTYFIVTVVLIIMIGLVEVYVLKNQDANSLFLEKWKTMFYFAVVSPAIGSILHIFYIERGVVSIKFLLWLVILIMIIGIPIILLT